ncbi:MAG: sigma-70 family RNA polymerase sigma factor [Acidobacteriota bacterium]
MDDTEDRAGVASPERIDRAVADLAAGRAREASFEILFFAYHDRLFGFFHRRGLTREEAEDLVQESLLAVEQAISSFRGEAPFSHWLFGLAANTYRRFRRHASAEKRRGQEVPLEIVERPDSRDLHASEALSSDEPSPLDRTIGLDERRRLQHATDQLPRQMRRCAVLRWIEGYDTKDIAKILALNPATVRVQLFRARRQLGQVLQELRRTVADQPEGKA